MTAAPAAIARLVLIGAATARIVGVVSVPMALLRRAVILRRRTARLGLASCTTVGREVTLLISPVFLLQVALDVPRIVLVEDLLGQLLQLLQEHVMLLLLLGGGT